MNGRRPRCASLLAGAFMALAACGGGGGDDSPPEATADGAATSGGTPGTPLTVKAGDLFFEPAAFQAPSGPITFTYVNEGAQPHTLLVDGTDGFKLDVLSKGDTDTGTVSLQPGGYTLYCDVPGHREVGMEASLEVR